MLLSSRRRVRCRTKNKGKASRTHFAVGLMLGSICSIINKIGNKGTEFVYSICSGITIISRWLVSCLISCRKHIVSSACKEHYIRRASTHPFRDILVGPWYFKSIMKHYYVHSEQNRSSCQVEYNLETRCQISQWKKNQMFPEPSKTCNLVK